MSSASSTLAVTPGGDREPVLDGVRGLAILLVLIYHVTTFGGLDDATGLDAAVVTLASPLWLGVDLFFVLSGFLITGILFDTKGSPVFFQAFYGRRVLRIFPLYYGFLAFAVLFFPLWLQPESANNLMETQAWYWFYLSNVQVAIHGWQSPMRLGHLWSLAVEEQFYLLWPLAVWACSRTQLIRIAGVCCVIALVLRVILPFGMSEVAAYVLLPTRMDSLAAGALLALVIRGDKGMAVLGRWPFVIFVTCVSIFIGLKLLQHAQPQFQAPVRALRHTFIAGASASLIALAITASSRSNWRLVLGCAPLRFLGKYSYGMYVLHLPIIFFVVDAGFRADQFPAWRGSMLPGLIVFGLGCAALSIASAVLVFHAWEAPFLRLKKHLPYVPSSRPKRHFIERDAH